MTDRHLDQAKGRLKEVAGIVTGDERLRRAGEIDQAAAHVKQAAGRVIERARVALRRAT
ncbi:MAG TPA: CsbD family protein [Solirubrobacteraceae bacterium]|jgi:uncharacterized protein YjbJ (UPF0337 family)|nr:CsbD family protein [Solirubrobacteraceae bacterium]